MTEPNLWQSSGAPAGRTARSYGQGSSANLADVLERVLDKGVVIAGDIQINLLDIELLTIKLRLLVASVDKAKEMGIDWWEHDPSLSSGAPRRDLADENRQLRERIARLEGTPAESAIEPAAEPTADDAERSERDGAPARAREENR